MSWACEVISRGRLWPFFGDQRKKVVREEVERLSLSELPWIYTCAVYLTKDSEMAEELVKDTYLQAFRHFKPYGGSTNCRVWLLSILRNIFIHRYRKRVGEPGIINWNKLHQDDGLAVSIAQLDHQEVESAVKALPEENRLAILLVDIEELGYQGAARVMECSVSRLRSRLSRGRWMLQAVLRNDVRSRSHVGR